MISIEFVLAFAVWLPVSVVVFSQLVRGWEFAQRHNYSLRHIYLQLEWGLGTDRSLPLQIAKVLCIIPLSLFILYPTSTVPLAAAGVAFLVWVLEVFRLAELGYNQKIAWQKLTQRVALLSVASFGLMSLPVIMLSLFLPNNALPSVITLADFTQLVPQETVYGFSIPYVYIFIVFSALLGILYDLGTPGIILIVLAITKPFRAANNNLSSSRLRAKLARLPHLHLVYVVSHQPHPLLSNALDLALKQKHVTHLSPQLITHISELHKLLSQVDPQTKIVIVQLHPYLTAGVKSIITNIPPHIIVTDIPESKLVSDLHHQLKATIIQPGANDQITISNALGQKTYRLTVNKRALHIISNSGATIELNLPHFHISKRTLGLAAILGSELGIQAQTIVNALSEIDPKKFGMLHTRADNQSELWWLNKHIEVEDAESAQNLIREQESHKNVVLVVWGKVSPKTLSLLTKANDTVDVLISNNQNVTRQWQQNNTRTRCELVRSANQAQKVILAELSPESITIVLGPMSKEVIANLAAG